MQYKKPEVKQRIIQAATDEYFAKSYYDANIHVISSNCQVPVGNLYRYFEGKSGILDAIVTPVIQQLPLLFARLGQDLEVLDETTSEKVLLLVDTLLDFFERYYKEIIILIDKSAHSRYEDYADELCKLVAAMIERKLYPDATAMDRRLSQTVAKALLGSILDCLRAELPREELKVMILRLINFYFYEANKRK